MSHGNPKRAILATMVAGALAFASGACGQSNDDEPDATSGAGGEPATAWYLTGAPNEEITKKSFEDWSAAHADQKIVGEVYANDAYKEKIRTAIGAGNPPTLVFNWGAAGVVAEYVAQNKVIDLTGKVDQALSRTLDSINKAGQIDGKQYAVPVYGTQPVILYYNKALFEQAGVEAPFKTWDELLASIPKFKAIGVAPIALAGQSKWPDLMWLEYLADRVGGPEAFNAVAAGEADSWSNPDMLKALEMIQDLVAADGFQESFGSTTTDSNADVALVHTGEAAMLLQGSWCYGTFKADAPEFVSGGDLGTMVFPTVQGGKGDPNNIAGNPANYWSVAADATEAQQQAVIDYINSEAYTDETVDALIAGGAVPPASGIEDKLAAADDADFLLQAYDLVKNAPNFQMSWDQVLSSVQAQELLTQLDAIFMGTITPQEFADNMNAVIGQ
ncbi:MAG: extracellular solute-binding protein [Bifidobacteriaceae bacterium]|jgi:raffinose/stachyose/melibiose transport system substrate-binding protein|nr:extracellular solute-binding protein [Bifidobacteriaceae bacterium]